MRAVAGQGAFSDAVAGKALALCWSAMGQNLGPDGSTETGAHHGPESEDARA